MTSSVWADGFEPRLDKKCGNSGIPNNAVCRVGAGATARGNTNRGGAVRRGLEKAAIIGGTAAFAGGLGQTAARARKGNFKGAIRSLQIASAGQTVAGAGLIARGIRRKSAVSSALGGRMLGTGVVNLAATTKLTGDLRQAKQGLSNMGSRVASGARSAMYRRRSGPARHTGYLPTSQARPVNARRRSSGTDLFNHFFK